MSTDFVDIGCIDDDPANWNWIRNVKVQKRDTSQAAFILIRAKNADGKWRYLLTKRADDENDKASGLWSIPGGKLHPGEDPWEGALRESVEEIGELPSMLKPRITLVDDNVTTFVCEMPVIFTPDMAGAETAFESAGWGWFSRGDVEDLPLHPAFEDTWESINWKELGKILADPDIIKRADPMEIIIKVGPRGYVHGWIYVGPDPGKDSEISGFHNVPVKHPEHGNGVASWSHHSETGQSDKISVDYEDGSHRTYDAQFSEAAKPHFKTGTQPGKPLTGMPARTAVPGKWLADDGKEDPISKSVNRYTGIGYETVNGALRMSNGDLDYFKTHEDDDIFDDSTIQDIKNLDSAMSKSAITHAITTARGIESGSASFHQAWKPHGDMTGASWVDDGFESTTTKPSTAEFFSGVGLDSVQLNITSPPGIHAIAIDSDDPNTEQEIILERGLKYTVTADHGDNENDVRELDVTVSEMTPEDFGAPLHHPAYAMTPAAKAAKNRFVETGRYRILSLPHDHPDVIKVGPHGYVHGWIYVGPGVPADTPDYEDDLPEVTHPEHGHGRVTHSPPGKVTVSYDDGSAREYDAKIRPQESPHFESGASGNEPFTGMPARTAIPGKYDMHNPIGWKLGDPETPEHAVRAYSASSYRTINRMLREKPDLMGVPSITRDQVLAIDKAMSQSVLTHDIESARGIRNGPATFGQAWRSDSGMTGASWVDHGFSSTSLNENIASGFTEGSDEPVLMNIHTPAGIHAVAIGDDSEDTEQEILLDRGLKYTITGDTIGPGESGIRELDVLVSQA